MSCSGVIVLNSTHSHVLIVLQDNKRNYGFPKGGHEKGETIEQTAFRELQEETGLTRESLRVLDGKVVNEISLRKGQDNPTIAVHYLVAEFVGGGDPEFQFDPKEIDSVTWMPLDQACLVLKVARVKALLEARALLLVKETPPSPKEETKTQKKMAAGRAKSISKCMSWVLRHGAKDLGLAMDSAGYVAISDLLAVEQMRSLLASRAELIEVVHESDKQRYSLNEAGDRVRANQGHSHGVGALIKTEQLLRPISLEEAKIMECCVHGTTKEGYLKICKDNGGTLRPMGRVHTHFCFSGDIKHRLKQSTVFIWVNMVAASAAGIRFYESDNHVILSPDAISQEFFARVDHGTS